MTQNGWRKPTPGLLRADRFAEVGERLSISKTRAIVAVKKVAAMIGLKSQDMLLIDTFGAVTQPQDWEQGRRPIVWASNHFLMEQTGFSLATLRRHVQRLYEVGVITMKDSPNGKRWGRRDGDGVIIEAYGFDLAPMAARAEEFEALYANLKTERAQCAMLRNTITVTRRMIRAKLDEAQDGNLDGPWQDLQQDYERLKKAIPDRSAKADILEDIAERFRALLEHTEITFSAVFDQSDESEVLVDEKKVASLRDGNGICEKTRPKSFKNETHIQTTKQLHPVESSSFEERHPTSKTYENTETIPNDESENIDLNINWSTHTKAKEANVDVKLLMACCPHFAEMAHSTQGYVKDWNDVYRAASALRSIVGISKDAWNIANKVLGPVTAAASIALILDKSSDGHIHSPGGYLRGLIERAKVGELNLERSFFGRLSAARNHDGMSP